ncbi:MAG: efflux RND transporter permease subunit [Treponema sp.]|nr:efflux RND transporter permease subunit [Treponema sp.]
MSLSRKTMDHPILVLIIFALLGLLGIFTFSKVAIALFPDVENPVLMIMTTYSNAGPESVEKTITKTVESAVVSVSGLKNMTSTSNEGSSTVQLEFDYGTNLDEVINDVRDKLDRVKRALPDAASTPSIFRFSSDSMPIMRILVRGNRSVDDIKQIAEKSIVDILEQADGVAEASVNGGRTAQVNVELDSNRMQAYGYTIPTITAALAKQNLELGGGKVQEGSKNYIVRTTGEYTSIEEINNTVISTVNGYNIRLRDVGTASLGFAETSQESFINGEKGVYVSITKQSGSNTVNVANNVYKKLDQLKGTLPPDITLEIISDDTESIRETINILVESLLQGLILSVIILWVFLQSFKSTIIIGISIPLSMIITLFAMNMFGITLNMMTLTGLILGLGMVVDASIVMIENIYAYRQRGARPKVAAILGSQEMLMSVISGNLTTICVFVPFLFFIKELGMMGQMFKGIIFTIVIALVSSLLVAIFLVPVLAGKFLPLTNRNEKPVSFAPLRAIYWLFQKIIDFFTKLYSKLLKLSLNNRAVTIVLALCILGIAFAMIPTLKINMMPMGNDDSVTLNIRLPVGTAFDETKEVVLAMEEIVKNELKGTKNVTTTIGGGGRNSSTNSGSIQITLPDSESQIDSSAVMQQKLRAHFDDYPGTSFSFRAGMRGQMFGSDIDIVLRSDDLEAALETADKISDVIKDNKECGEPYVSMDKGLPQVEVVIDRDRAYNFGVDITTVAREINYAINGTTACVFRSNGKDYNVVVAYRPEDRKKLEDLESIYVRGSKGMVSVANFASLKKGLGPVSIRRENQTRIIHVTTSILSETNANIIEQQIKDGISEAFIIPDSVNISYEGSWGNTMEQLLFYMKILAMAVLLVFGVMAATYESFKAPLINLATMPFLVIGVIFLYKIIGQPISIISMVGVIMLVGIVVNNGIILVDYTNLLVGRGIPLKQACYEAGSSRFRPVMMTTLTTILGMLPMCFATGGQAMMVQPIALAVVGGLMSSTFVTLLIIPVLYSLVMKKRDKKKSLIAVKYETETDAAPKTESPDTETEENEGE